MQLQTGVIRLKRLDETISGGAQPILFLPPPSKNGLTLEYTLKSTTVDLINGAPRTRLLGYIPVLEAKWNYYKPEHFPQYSIGNTNNNMLSLDDLLKELSTATGTLAVSPGLTAGWFTVDSIQVKAFGVIGVGSLPSGVDVVFTGRDILSQMALS